MALLGIGPSLISPTGAVTPSLLEQFYPLLSARKYQDCAKVVQSYLNENRNIYPSGDITLKLFRMDTVDHLNQIPEPNDECTVLLDVLVALDTHEKAYGLHTDWLKANAPWFRVILQTFVRALVKNNCSTEEIQVKLAHNLSAFLSYTEFNLEQAKMILAELPGFDPRKPSNPINIHTLSYIELARRINKRHDLISYLESISPEPIPIKTIDFSQFCGIAELKGKDCEPNVRPKKGEFLLLDTTQKVYDFIGSNPIVEGDQEFIQDEVNWRKNKHRLSLQQAQESVRDTVTNTYSEYEDFKVLLGNREIEVYCAENLNLDGTLSDGHKTVGTVTFKGKQVFCKFTNEFWKKSIRGFQNIKEECDLVMKLRKLREKVSNIVEVLPYVVLNKSANGNCNIGYFMQVVSGIQLRKISQLSPEEKKAIQAQFDSAVEAMFESGYALYDFNDDNVLWDGKKLTFIDLNASGFKQEHLQNADTYDVMARMMLMLEGKKVVQNSVDHP